MHPACMKRVPYQTLKTLYFERLILAGDLDGSGSYTPALSFEFEGLECSGACDISASAGALDEDSSGGSTGRTIAIVVGSVVSGIGLAALVSG